MNANTATNGVPIGTILAWHKNLPNTPPLPFGFVECNGQVLNDTASPYNNQTMPNLNGEGRFLRGANKSGISQEMDWKSFYIQSLSGNDYTHEPTLIPKSNYNPVGLFGGKWEILANKLYFKFDDSEVRPINMSVVWIIRVK